MKLKKISLWFVIIICVVGAVFFMLVDPLIKYALESRVSRNLGLNLSVEEVDVEVWEGAIRCEGILVSNPEGFGNAAFITMPVLYVNFDLSSLFGDEKRFEKIEVNIQEIGIVKNQAGELNLMKLKELQEQAQKGKTAGAAKKQTAGSVGIEVFMLTLDHIRFLDFSQGEEPDERILRVGIDHQRFKDVESPEAIAKAVVIATVMEASSREGGMEDLLAVAENLQALAGEEMAERLGELKKMQ